MGAKVGLFSKKPKPSPFNPFVEGVSNNFNSSSPEPIPPQSESNEAPLDPTIAPPTTPIVIQPEPAQVVDASSSPLLETTELNTPDPIEAPTELTEPTTPLTQPQYTAETTPPSPPTMEITEPTPTEQQSIIAEIQADTSGFTPDQAPVEPQAVEPIIAETAPSSPLENTESAPSPVDSLIANSQSSLEITDRPSSNFFRKNLIPLIIVGVVVIALSALSLVFYIKWQGEKADNLEKAGAINNLTSQLQSLKDDNTDDANLASELDELREEINTLTTDKLKLEENNKTLTDQNTTLKKQNDELNKQAKTTACEAMTNTTEKQKCLDSVNTPTATTE